MKTKIALTLVVAFAMAFMFSTVVRADDAKVAGKWEMTSEGRNGPQTRAMTIEQNGDKIKGTMTTPRGEQAFTGSIKGKDITIIVTFQTPNGDRTVEYKGKVDDDMMKGTVEMMGNAREWTAKRVKS